MDVSCLGVKCTMCETKRSVPLDKIYFTRLREAFGYTRYTLLMTCDQCTSMITIYEVGFDHDSWVHSATYKSVAIPECKVHTILTNWRNYRFKTHCCGTYGHFEEPIHIIRKPWVEFLSWPVSNYVIGRCSKCHKEVQDEPPKEIFELIRGQASNAIEFVEWYIRNWSINHRLRDQKWPTPSK